MLWFVWKRKKQVERSAVFKTKNGSKVDDKDIMRRSVLE